MNLISKIRNCIFMLSCLIIILMLLVSRVNASKSYSGNSGLIITPSADIAVDGEMVTGFSYLPSPAVFYMDGPNGEEHAYVTLGYLPFLEITMRYVYSFNSGLNFPVGDRSVYLRGQIIKESENLPALTLGIHDPYGTTKCNDTYLVASKTYDSGNFSFQTTIGYGRPCFKLRGKHHFQGVFGGIKLIASSQDDIFFEYDSENINLGINRKILKYFDLGVALFDWNYFGLRICHSFNLK